MRITILGLALITALAGCEIPECVDTDLSCDGPRADAVVVIAVECPDLSRVTDCQSVTSAGVPVVSCEDLNGAPVGDCFTSVTVANSGASKSACAKACP
jgi:hypothetical protein